MMAYYCSNYYGSIQCRTTVPRFGERCKLCTVLRVGASMTNGLLPTDMAYGLDTPKTNGEHTHNLGAHALSAETTRRPQQARVVK